MKYLIVVEKTSTGFSAYSPDIPVVYRQVGQKRRSKPT